MMMNKLSVAGIIMLLAFGPVLANGQVKGGVRGPLDRSRTYYEGKTGQPLNSIRVEVRYRKEYGYKYDAGAIAGTGRTSCPAFAVYAKPSKPVRLDKPIPVTTDSRTGDAGSHYVCYFLISELPHNIPILVRASLSSYRQLPTEAWKGGSLAQPPAGQQRVIANDSRILSLSEREPRASIVFEMTYGPLR